MKPPHIPDPIPFAEVSGLCKQLGLDPAEVESLEFRVYGLYVTFHARDDEGCKLSDGQDVARHRIFVPYVREETQ